MKAARGGVGGGCVWLVMALLLTACPSLPAANGLETRARLRLSDSLSELRRSMGLSFCPTTAGLEISGTFSWRLVEAGLQDLLSEEAVGVGMGMLVSDSASARDRLAFDLFLGAVLPSSFLSFAGRPLFLPVPDEDPFLVASELCAGGGGAALFALDFVAFDELPGFVALVMEAVTASGTPLLRTQVRVSKVALDAAS